MQAQMGYDDILQADLQESASKVRDQSDHIQALEQQLKELNQIAEEGKGATQLISNWIEAG